MVGGRAWPGYGRMGGRRGVARWTRATRDAMRERARLGLWQRRDARGAVAGWAGWSQREGARVSLLNKWAAMGFAVGMITDTTKPACLPCVADQAHCKHTFFLYDFFNFFVPYF